MESNSEGLSRPVRAGEYVVLSTGAIARTLEAYPAGYTGALKLILDEQDISELAQSIVLPQGRLHSPGASENPPVERAPAEQSLTREPDKRMRD